MNSCRPDASSSPRFKSEQAPFLKKHRKFKNDWRDALAKIEADHRNACEAARVPNRKFDPSILEVWKYSIPCADMNRSAKKGFRAIGVFLDPEVEGRARDLYFVLFYYKGDKADFTKEELESAVAFLKGELQKKAAAAATEVSEQPPVAEILGPTDPI
jgi:hypothetical protein